MALLRSEIFNKDFVESILRKIEGTKRVILNTLTVAGGSGNKKSSLLEDKFSISISANVYGHEKEYFWIAKVLRDESKHANYARFQGILETEVNFYERLVPELAKLGSPMPQTFPYVHGDYHTYGREVLITDDLTNNQSKYEEPVLDHDGLLDLDHVLLAVEWLAKLHGLSYILLERYSGGPKQWIRDNPWVRSQVKYWNSFAQRDILEFLASSQREDLRDDVLTHSVILADAGNLTGARNRLLQMAAISIKHSLDTKTDESVKEKLQTLLERQDWLDSLKEDFLVEDAQSKDQGFFTLRHGEPWMGNAYFLYKKRNQARIPLKVAFTDFHATTYGRPGFDLAHFLVTSTSREFRKIHLESILKVYHSQLEDVIESQGDLNNPYKLDAIRSDYKRGLVLGIAFSLFAMPMLIREKTPPDCQDNSEEDQVDGGANIDVWNISPNSSASLDTISKTRLVDALMDVLD